MFSTRNKAARKLTLSAVEEIRRRYDQRETQGVLSREFGVSVGQIGRIVRGESWQTPEVLARHLPPEYLTQPGQTAIMDRLLARVDPAIAAQIRAAPLSMLEGGEPPDETAGTGTAVLSQKAKDLGAK